MESPSESGKISRRTSASSGTRTKFATRERSTNCMFLNGSMICYWVRENPMTSMLESTNVSAARTPIVPRRSRNYAASTLSLLHPSRWASDSQLLI